MVSPLRRPVVWATLAAVFSLSTARAEPLLSERRLVDRGGLEFVSSDAFCALHCKPWRVVDRELTECNAVRCASHRRRLDAATNAQVHSADSDEDQVVSNSKLSVLSCGDETSANQVNYNIDAAASSAEVFHEFHTAFFKAFDALITSENASYEACQLQWLQQELLPNATVDKTTSNSTVGARPTLIRIDPKADQRACVAQIKTIWTSDDESVTPFLSRLDQSSASATVLLVHVNGSVVKRLSALDCVQSATELPSILKLLPLARSAAQVNSGKAAPKVWIRVLKGATPQTVFNRLQAKIQAMYGVTNIYEMPERPDLFPRGVFIKSVEQLEVWTHAVAVAVADGEVEWIDAKHEITMNGLKGTSYEHLRQQRRLDDYVDSLVGVDPAQQKGINGDNIVVGITDTGLYIDHDQFDQASRNMYDKVDKTARKVIYYNTWADQYDQGEDITCGHGTHVSGLLAGSSFSGNSKNFGIAANAQIAFMDIGTQDSSCAGQKGCAVQLATPGEAKQLLQSQISAGAKIFSFSWGTAGSDYSYQARDLDAFVYENPDILIVIAAGNSGEESTNGQGTISSPSGAKNVISVGASLNAAESFTDYPCPNVFNPGSVASFSSAGPTTDGRLKPDVVAPGMILVSSRSEKPGSTTKSSQTCSLQGTSQATPVVTGIAVLLYQWLRDGYWKAGKKDATYGMSSIPAALLKALIIHSGDSLQRRLAKFPSGAVSCGTIEGMAWGVSYPDVYQGYGKPNMSNIADFSGSESTPTLYFLPNSTAGSEPSVANGKEVRISFTVPRGVDLRATLVWTDPAGSIQATTQLQHDLDLSVQIRNASKLFYPLTASNTTNRDEKNNVEMVQVSYQQLVDAINAEGKSSSLIGPSGEIIVEAIIYGRSVLSADSQAFAFVASSSVIGTTSGSAGSNKRGGGSTGLFGSSDSDSFWKPWTIAVIGAGAFLLLSIIASCVCCCTRRNQRRGPPAAMVTIPPPQNGGMMYHPYNTPANVNRSGLETCPYCTYTTADPVVMVNHVENMHPNGGMAVNAPGTGGFGLPPSGNTQAGQPYGSQPFQYEQPQYQHPEYPMYHEHQHVAAPVGHNLPNARQDERCPFCTFVSSDAVILVNHVENMHGEQRMV